MTFQEYFLSVKEKFGDKDVSNFGENLAYEFHVTGEEQGTFYVEVKDGKLNIEPYDYHDRAASFTASAKVFNDIMAGKTDPVLAFTLKKLKVDGDLGKALRIKELIDKK